MNKVLLGEINLLGSGGERAVSSPGMPGENSIRVMATAHTDPVTRSQMSKVSVENGDSKVCSALACWEGVPHMRNCRQSMVACFVDGEAHLSCLLGGRSDYHSYDSEIENDFDLSNAATEGNAGNPREPTEEKAAGG